MPSAGDTLTIVFDRRTSKGRSARPPPPEPRTKAYADFFLEFSPSIGTDYYGEFTDDSTFVLTIVQGACTIANGAAPDGSPGVCDIGVEPYQLTSAQVPQHTRAVFLDATSTLKPVCAPHAHAHAY